MHVSKDHAIIAETCSSSKRITKYFILLIIKGDSF